MLDHKVTIQYHVNKKMKKTMKGIGVLRKLKPTLSRFYQSILLQPSNDTFFQQTRSCSMQYVFSNYGSNKSLCREILCQELWLDYLQQKRWIRSVCLFYKVVSTNLPAYIYDFSLPVRQSQRHPNTFNSSCRTDYFENPLFSLRYR